VAHALACRLQQSGARVGFLGLMNSYQSSGPDGPVFDPSGTLRELAEMVGVVPGPNGELDLDAIVDAARRWGHPLGELEHEQAQRIFPLLVHHANLLRDVRPGTFDGRMILFIAARGPGKVVTPDDWTPSCTGPVRACHLDCTHNQMTDPEAIREIGGVVEESLAQD
jgi:thioesterase domain-containing protein